MSANERWNQIITILKAKKSITLNQIKKSIYVSDSTLRRDLIKLESLGLLKRVRGGAVIYDEDSQESSVFYRINKNKREKKIIAELCLPLINNSSTMFMDSSSTTSVLCNILGKKSNITVITNGINNGKILSEHPNVKVRVPSGTIYNKSNSILGGDTIKYIDQFHCDYFVFSMSGLSTETGLTEVTHEQKLVKSCMMKNAVVKILLIDDSKFGKSFLSKLEKINLIDFLVTNKELPTDIEEYLNNYNIRIIHPPNKK